MSDDFRTPGKEEVQRDLKRGVAGTGRRSRAKKGLAAVRTSLVLLVYRNLIYYLGV